MKFSSLRQAGVLAHISSLPSPYGTGGFGKDTFAFLDLIKKAGFSFWQVLPLCPIGYGASPYSSISAFAGNELFIDPEILYKEGYLGKKDNMPFYVDRSRTNWEWVKEYKMPLLIKASKKFLSLIQKNKKLDNKFKAFKEDSKYWLDDYALFRVLGNKYDTYSWNTSWDEDVKKRDKVTLKKIENDYKSELEEWKALQFFFFDQWNSIKKYANDNGIKIIGDMPYCSSKDSAEVWAHNELFYFDSKLNQTKSVGVPPDAFSTTGQLWGNPQYKWENHKKENFKFWKERIKVNLVLFDYLRLDHFRGFLSSWTVDSKEKTAEKGKWLKSLGDELFEEVYKELNITEDNNPFIAEDLGVITKEVDALREKFSLPSLRVMQFAWNHNNKDPHLPHMWDENVIAYLGTHDNNTLIGWWQENASEYEKNRVKAYLYANDENAPWYMIRSLFASRAPVAMITLQDLLFLPSFARFNTPGTVSKNNWTWRMTSMFDTDKFRSILEMFARV